MCGFFPVFGFTKNTAINLSVHVSEFLRTIYLGEELLNCGVWMFSAFLESARLFQKRLCRSTSHQPRISVGTGYFPLANTVCN